MHSSSAVSRRALLVSRRRQRTAELSRSRRPGSRQTNNARASRRSAPCRKLEVTSSGAVQPLLFAHRGRVELDQRRARLGTKTAAGFRDPLRAAGGFQDIHAYDQSALEPISMAGLGVGEELTGLGVADDLVDADRDAPI
jgi:hypothetical protein